MKMTCQSVCLKRYDLKCLRLSRQVDGWELVLETQERCLDLEDSDNLPGDALECKELCKSIWLTG